MTQAMADVPTGFKPKKSVALSGVPAGNTALCTVGRSGNDLHYRGYDILDIAQTCEFEEIAYLLVHEKLPTAAELAAYKSKLQGQRDLPPQVKSILENIPKTAHAMDVLRTGVSALGTVQPEKDDHSPAGARDIADRLMACMGSMLLYWHHFSRGGKRIEVQTDDDSIGGHFLHLLHGKPASRPWVAAMHTSLILYAEHEFNASTFTARVIAGTGSDIYSSITGAIGALAAPSTAEPTKRRWRFNNATPTPIKLKPTSAAASKIGKSFWVSAIRSTRFPIRATRSSSRSPKRFPRRPAT